ncbi:hypothetical protein [Salinicoccus albus]|uniref:hypothetical protein n=1 Tax=Salinicoccus albus TaxID=418756 RepID=UPI0003811BA0|nr:hypothetical protein [Salinicoccus albus]
MLVVESTENITKEKSLVDKLMEKDTLTKTDIQQLQVFNDDYIDRLLAAGQMTARYKVVEALMRDGMTTT